MQPNPPMLVIGNPPPKSGRRTPFHFAKGSPEAREHMARLRAMRGKKQEVKPLTAPDVRSMFSALDKAHPYKPAGLSAEDVRDMFRAKDRSKNPRKKKSRRLVKCSRCGYCGGMDFTYMGQLGPSQAYRCRRCGMDKVVRGANPMPISQDPTARMWAVDVRLPKSVHPRGRDRHFVLARTKQEAVEIVSNTLLHDYGTGRVTRVSPAGGGRPTNPYARQLPPGMFGANPLNDKESHTLLKDALDWMRVAKNKRMGYRRGLFLGTAIGAAGAVADFGKSKKARRIARKMLFRAPPPRRRNPGEFPGVPAHIANDPMFRAEVAAYRKRHGSGPVRISQIRTPDGFPKFLSVYGKAPEIKYDAPGHSNKGKRIHKFGEGGGSTPWLVTSAARGPRFLAFVGGTFRAGNWLYR